ncbi:transmembrane protein 233-like [Bufo bufo]|uniref:transmembrane protein 233-like n=1 Tax=Bufo bufo TaxID=8384 RepID=UPI001ABE53EE|nr:transmembrane protein 233-like [Bufo bufo]
MAVSQAARCTLRCKIGQRTTDLRNSTPTHKANHTKVQRTEAAQESHTSLLQLRIKGDCKKMYEPTSNAVTVQPEQASYRAPQKDYLIWSIVNLLCCCLPLGIVALLFSIKTRDACHQNDTVLANRSSRTAFNLNIAATVIGIVIIIIAVVVYVLVFTRMR